MDDIGCKYSHAQHKHFEYLRTRIVRRLLSIASQQGLQQMVFRCLIRVYYRDSAPCELMLHILTEKQAAALLSSHGKDQGIPYLQVVARYDIHS